MARVRPSVVKQTRNLNVDFSEDESDGSFNMSSSKVVLSRISE